MALTDAEEARFQELHAKYGGDTPTLPGRIGLGMANLLTDLPERAINMAGGVSNWFTDSQIPKTEIPAPFDIPAPVNYSEAAADLVPGLAEMAASVAAPELLATRGMAALGAAPRLAGMIGAISGGAAYGAADSPHEAEMQGALFGLQRFGDYLPRLARIPFALTGGIASGMEAYSAGASPVQAFAIGGINAASGLIGGKIHTPEPPIGLLPNGTPIPTPTKSANPTGYNFWPSQEERGPFKTPWGPAAEGPRFNPSPLEAPPPSPRGPSTPWGPTEIPPRFRPPEPSAAEAAVAMLQPPETPTKPDIHDIRPAININGERHIGEKFDSHQNILDRYLNFNIEDSDALLNFDLKPTTRKGQVVDPGNPNFFHANGQDISRAELKEMYGVSDSQGLRRLQKASEVPPPPVTPPVPERGPFKTPWGPSETPARFEPKQPEVEQVKPEVVPEPIPPVLPKDMTPAERRVARMNAGKVAAAERRASIAKINGTPEEVPPVVPSEPKEKKSRAKPLDLEAYTEGNDLRVVPEKGEKGGTVFETMRPVDPKAGKLKFEVPPGTSHAEANKLFKTKKKELVATLQQQATTATPVVPFQDVASANMTDTDVHKMGLDVSTHDVHLSQAPAVQRLRKLTGSESGATTMDTLVRMIGPIGGGLTGFAMDDDNRGRGLFYGFLAGGLLQHYGAKGIKAILKMDFSHFGKEFADVAAEGKFRGRGGTIPQAARAFEHYFGSNEKVNLALTKAQGKAAYATAAFNKALKYVSQKYEGLPPAVRDAWDYYATTDPLMAPTAFAQLKAVTSDAELLSAALLERHTRMNAQLLWLEGLDPAHPMYQPMVDSIGTYSKTAFEIHTNPKFMPEEKDVTNTIFELRSLGHTEDIAREAVHHYLHETYVERAMRGISGGGGSFTGPAKGAESLADVIRKKNPELMQRPAFRAMMGEITDPLQVRAATALKLIPAIRSGQFFSEMADAVTERGNKFALTGDEWDAGLANLRAQIAAGPPHVATLQSQLHELENYMRTPDDHQLGKLSGKYVHRQVVDRLPSNEGFLGANAGPLIQGMMQINNHVKAAKVGANPLSWIRSAFSIPFFMAVSRAGSPDNWVAAAREIHGKTAMWKEMVEQGILSGGYGTGETKKDMGMILDPSITEGSTVGVLWNKLVHMGAGAMDAADNITRAAAYMAAKERIRADIAATTTVTTPSGTTTTTKGFFRVPRGPMLEPEIRDTATQFVNRLTPNYSTASKGVRALRQMPFMNQFITYSSEIAKITKNLIVDVKTNRDGNRWHALAALAGIPAIFEGAQLIFEGNLDKKDKEEWDKIKPLLPAYERGGFLLPTKKKADGAFEYFNISPLFIADDISKMVKSLAHGDWEAVKANNPLVGWDNTPAITVGAAAYGLDLRTGRSLDTIGQQIDTIRKEVLPPLFGGYEMDKFVKSLTPNAEGTLGISNPVTGQRFNFSDLLATYYTGVRRRDVKYPILLERAYNVSQARVRAVEGELRQVMITNAADIDKQAAVERARKKILAIEEDFKRQINYQDQGK